MNMTQKNSRRAAMIALMVQSRRSRRLVTRVIVSRSSVCTKFFLVIYSILIIIAGITNQRETTVAWSKKTGKSLCPAIVWDDARTKNVVAHYEAVLEKEGIEVDGVYKKGKEGVNALREL
jgi:glycerol kinase